MHTSSCPLLWGLSPYTNFTFLPLYVNCFLYSLLSDFILKLHMPLCLSMPRLISQPCSLSRVYKGRALYFSWIKNIPDWIWDIKWRDKRMLLSLPVNVAKDFILHILALIETFNCVSLSFSACSRSTQWQHHLQYWSNFVVNQAEKYSNIPGQVSLCWLYIISVWGPLRTPAGNVALQQPF